MVSLFDHRFGTYKDQTEVQAGQGKLSELTPEQHDNPTLLSLPHYWVHEANMRVSMVRERSAFVVFRNIARSTDIRTTIFSLIPCGPCGNSLPIALSDYTKELAFLTSNLASFILDYVARQKVGGANLNFFIINQFPVLPPSAYQQPCLWSPARTLGDWITPRALELIYTAWDLEAFAQDCGYGGPPFRWNEERRFLLRCELDAAYFILYEIARDDVMYIMDTFRVWKEKEEKLFGNYRTKRVILEIYDEMMQAIENGQTYNTRLVPPPADPTQATIIEQQHAS